MMAENIFLFVPNLIGYARILLAFASFYFMPFDHVTAITCYMLSSGLDAIDGHAARYLGQGTKFGAMLDMLTDRCGTMCLIIVLCQFYPKYTIVLMFNLCVDIVSHWMHTWVSAMKGSSSHKVIDLEGNPILKHYYTNRIILFLMCAGNELFFGTLYLIHFTAGPKLPIISLSLWTSLCVLCAPVAVMKTVISLVQLYAASLNVAAIDVTEREEAKKKST
ncbi:CDP-diacylglycerol--inositol 3-phosphatidyltransferase [Lingula anatina]|uniref:CDP-diacylglycerol--inositol 3-phosphatidyltransferase n=1 Tax=Lingula anatina TaxID=7574 RepID=A0A1S3JA34_LINAN|nr:CDP-diacylglycerol--inositol 3-phosphatidyltransferase [Lingula anatina]|eukprot:XP_013407265.1 CDP-diacylglycerol--inositol 3-phosphatidyltransferase [Lingula anatina]